MRKLLAAAALVVTFLPNVTSAQVSNGVSLRPHVFLAPGGVFSGPFTHGSLHVGGGLDAVVWKGLGAGIELGYAGGFPDGFDYGIGLLSFNASYHLPRRETARLVPFVTGGYTAVVIRGQGQSLNAGVGVDCWLREGFALRLEFRDHVRSGDRPAPDHLWGARVGFTWGRR